MKTIPAFALFESKLREEHQQQVRDERQRLEGEVPQMPPPKHGNGSGRPLEEPTGPWKALTAVIPSEHWVALAERARREHIPLAEVFRRIVKRDLALEGVAAA